MSAGPIRVLLAGDVMLGRGVDQVQRQSCDPAIFEPVLRDARDYVALAERLGPVPRGVAPGHVWGPLPEDLSALGFDLRIVNLETAITARGTPAPKGINYRMHPRNVAVLAAAGIDACVLANNHVLDWGPEGLADTRAALSRAGIGSAGAGTSAEAAAPLVLPMAGKGRLLLLAAATPDSGVPRGWAAQPDRAGVQIAEEDPEAEIARVVAVLAPMRRAGDVAIYSVHWGGNWGHAVPDYQRRLARGLIDRAGIALVHGHSAHHPKAVELHQGRTILFGCGDLINDYEGILPAGDPETHALAVAPVATIDPATGRTLGLTLLPYRIRGFALTRPTPAEAARILGAVARESARFATRIELTPQGRGELLPPAA